MSYNSDGNLFFLVGDNDLWKGIMTYRKKHCKGLSVFLDVSSYFYEGLFVRQSAFDIFLQIKPRIVPERTKAYLKIQQRISII